MSYSPKVVSSHAKASLFWFASSMFKLHMPL